MEIWGETWSGETVLIEKFDGYYEDAQERQDELMATGKYKSTWLEN